MAVDATLIVGPDRHGQTVHLADGLVVGSAPDGAEVVPCPDGEIRPGAVNAHTHLYSGLVPLGMPPPAPPPENFVQILERVWWRLDRALDPAALRAAARLYVAEALLAGTTSLIDHHESPAFIEGSLDVLADACHELGIRALLCYGATERNGGGDEAARGLEACRRFVYESQGDDLLRGLVALHASFTISDDTIRRAGDLCRELDVPLHIHVAEDLADVTDARQRGYDGPLERLAALDALPAGSILAHGIHLSAEQIRHAVDRGCWWVQNPRSNEGNQVGYAAELAASSQVALGTDGYPADMAQESEALTRLGGQAGDSADAMSARLGAGHRLISERFGTNRQALAPGAVGDLVVYGPSGVCHVVVGGRVVVRDGRLSGGDLDSIRSEATSQAQGLWQRMERLVATEPRKAGGTWRSSD